MHAKSAPYCTCQDGHDMIASFADITNLYQRNKHKIQQGINTLFTTDPNLVTMEQLMMNVTSAYIRMYSLFHAEWLV